MNLYYVEIGMVTFVFASLIGEVRVVLVDVDIDSELGLGASIAV